MPPYNNIYKQYYNPYNFSSISKRVYTPSWRNMISNDIPFTDGLSGSIDVSIKALTPIIIKEGKNSPLNVSHNGKYFIPGTSIKGMIRNVFEILSLSKIGSLTDDNRYSMRDFDNSDYTLKTKANTNQIKPGLLVKINDQYHLIESPKFEKLSYQDIVNFKSDVNVDSLRNAKTVKDKYSQIPRNPFYILNDDNEKYVLLLSGWMNGKKHEYGIQIPRVIDPKPLDHSVIDNFLFIHEHEVKSGSWNFWKTKTKITNFNRNPTYDELTDKLCFSPVFYTKDDQGKIKSLGLAFLHRELYANSIHDLLDKRHKSDDLDMAQCVFGSSDHDLKGRVQFSPAFVEMNGKEVAPDPDKIILGSPKPTFYPFYLKQDKNAKYASTFSDDNGKINGWKRYLTHNEFTPTIFEKWNDRIGIKIRPLPVGVTFTIKIRFHNLKPVELGALLSSLTFHNNQNKCFHLIGMGKPLGYGKLGLIGISLSVPKKDDTIQHYMAIFEKEISTESGRNVFEEWKRDVIPLFKMATGKFNQQIRYPVAFDEFKAIKSVKMSIVDFSPKLDDFELISLNN